MSLKLKSFYLENFEGMTSKPKLFTFIHKKNQKNSSFLESTRTFSKNHNNLTSTSLGNDFNQRTFSQNKFLNSFYERPPGLTLSTLNTFFDTKSKGKGFATKIKKKKKIRKIAEEIVNDLLKEEPSEKLGGEETERKVERRVSENELDPKMLIIYKMVKKPSSKKFSSYEIQKNIFGDAHNRSTFIHGINGYLLDKNYKLNATPDDIFPLKERRLKMTNHFELDKPKEKDMIFTMDKIRKKRDYIDYYKKIKFVLPTVESQGVDEGVRKRLKNVIETKRQIYKNSRDYREKKERIYSWEK